MAVAGNFERPCKFSGHGLDALWQTLPKMRWQKKRPMLFSQLEGENDEGEQFALDIEDEKSEFQPERSYTQKETQELVHELIDSLSDEQRLCILMYHLDDQSIKDIAETFGISENTVKSRLLYGRKAIKAKAEELQKKGYQLYTVAPVAILPVSA